MNAFWSIKMKAHDKEPDGSPDVLLLTASGVRNPFLDLQRDAAAAGLSERPSARPPIQRRAGLLYLPETPRLLFLLSPFLNDLYHWVKNRAPRLWKWFFGKDRQRRLHMALMRSTGPIKYDLNLAFSIAFPFRHGRVRLMFPSDCTMEEFRVSVHDFVDLMKAYAEGRTRGGIDLDNEKDCYHGLVILTLDREQGRLKVLNPYARAGLDEKMIQNARRLERQTRREEGHPPPRIEPTIGNNREQRMATFRDGSGTTTKVRYVNKRKQECLGHRDRAGTDYNQRAYKMRCGHCEHIYGANGSDVHHRRCPKCQGGKPGIPY